MYRELKNRGHNVKVVVLPLSPFLGSVADIHTTKDTLKPVLSEVDKDDLIFPCKDEAQKCESIEKYKPDYVVVMNPYGSRGKRISKFFDNKYLAKFTKVLYIPYGPEIWDLKYIQDKTLLRTFYKVLADSDMTKRVFMEKHGFPDEQVIVVGYQSYKDLRDEIRLSKGKDKKTETILWAPRWYVSFSERDGAEPGSTFLSYRDFFYNFAKENPNIKLIVRSHPSLYSHLLDNKFMTKVELIEMLKKFESLPNVEIIYPHDLPLLSQARDIVASDIIITDTTSLMVNFFIGDKPMIYLSNGFDTHFNTPEIQRMAEFMYFVYSPNDILKAIKELRAVGYTVTKANKLCKVGNSKSSKMCKIKKYLSSKSRSPDVDKLALMRALDPVENPAKAIADFIDND